MDILLIIFIFTCMGFLVFFLYHINGMIFKMENKHLLVFCYSCNPYTNRIFLFHIHRYRIQRYKSSVYKALMTKAVPNYLYLLANVTNIVNVEDFIYIHLLKCMFTIVNGKSNIRI